MVDSDDDHRHGGGACSVPEAARLLGISERAVRKRIDRGSLRAERAGGGAWTVHLPTEGAVPQGGTRGGAGTSLVPGAEYSAGMRTLFAEVSALYEAQLVAKDETIAALRARVAAAEREAATAQRNNRALAELELRRRLDPTPVPAPTGFWRRLRRALAGDD